MHRPLLSDICKHGKYTRYQCVHPSTDYRSITVAINKCANSIHLNGLSVGVVGFRLAVERRRLGGPPQTMHLQSRRLHPRHQRYTLAQVRKEHAVGAFVHLAFLVVGS